jgi:formiminotetrahydrofolate cyclodeaminase
MPPMTDRTTPLADLSIEDATLALASEAPTPGGGSAAAIAAALGASLTAMVARLSQDRPPYAAHAALHAEAVSVADDARRRLLELADADASAYAAYRAARRMPHATDVEKASRDAASRVAARQAAGVPLAVVQDCQALVELVERLVGRSNAAAASDLGVAALLLECAARGAAANALVNLPAVGDEAFAAAVRTEVEDLLRQIHRSTARTHDQVGLGVGAEAAPA